MAVPLPPAIKGINSVSMDGIARATSRGSMRESREKPTHAPKKMTTKGAMQRSSPSLAAVLELLILVEHRLGVGARVNRPLGCAAWLLSRLLRAAVGRLSVRQHGCESVDDVM